MELPMNLILSFPKRSREYALGNIVVERKHKVFNLTLVSKWTHAQRSMFMQFENSLFLRIDDTQRVIIVVDAPGYIRSILYEQLFIISSQRKLNTFLQAPEPAIRTLRLCFKWRSVWSLYLWSIFYRHAFTRAFLIQSK